MIDSWGWDPDHLSMWTIYDHPRDYPHAFVVRRTLVGQALDNKDYKLANTLAQARSLVPGYATRMDRHPDDDPVIVEVWF